MTQFGLYEKVANLGTKLDIAIVTVITNTTSVSDYEVALKSVECYSKIQNYKYLILVDSDYNHVCHQTHKFFLRHCIISHILPNYDAILFLDADHGVVNPKRRIEEYLDPKFDLTFYDRFFDWEVMAGSYIAKNTEFTRQFLLYWANFEPRMPRVRHGTDNAALHLVLAEQLFSDYPDQVKTCNDSYYKAHNTMDLGTYIGCVRQIFGVRPDLGKIRIIRKGAGWSRDDWLTSGIWSSRRDFMLHGWKTKQVKEIPDGVLEPIPMNYNQWYNPLAGPIIVEKCHPGNTTWSYNPKLLGDVRKINENLNEYAGKIERERAKAMAKLYEIIERT